MQLEEKVLQDIHRQAVKDSESVWGNPYAPLDMGHCSRCTGDKASKLQRCITDMLRFESICKDCWTREREAALVNEVEEMTRGKLDLEDFSRL